ncbi:hypothetical protein H4582DRAFT_2109058 [Lactarius indigo]|nr:hypothetical protein H4582DRAFT_2109058 [Lactarius indigo]
MPPRLQNLPTTSARVPPGQLTPRTPHSRYRARGDDNRDTRTEGRNLRDISRWLVVNSGLILGSGLAVVLFLMIILSYKHPDVLLSAVGVVESVASPTATALKQDDTQPLDTEHVISYENYTHFPLDPMEYKAECHKFMGEVIGPTEFWSGQKDVIHHEVNQGEYPVAEGLPTRTCSKTITYMLDGRVGLLADLALMAQAAGLARQVGRTFFVDDTYWNRGKWTDHFQDVRMRQPGPEPECRAPPPEELVACPRNASECKQTVFMTSSDQVVNSRTAKYHFGYAFTDEFEDPYGRQLNRLRGIFNQARESLIQTIRPNAVTASLIHSARTELVSFLDLDSNHSARNDQYQSIHVRLGDRMGSSWEYRDKNVPIEEYARASNAAWDRLFRPTGNSAPQAVYLASDDPKAFEELQSQLEPGSRVFSLATSTNADLSKIASPAPYFQAEFSALPEADRISLYFSGLWAWDDDPKPGAVICGIASNVCKMSAVALDWDRAFGYGFGDDSAGDVNQEHARWIEVDEKGNVSPPWRAFQLF